MSAPKAWTRRWQELSDMLASSPRSMFSPRSAASTARGTGDPSFQAAAAVAAAAAAAAVGHSPAEVRVRGEPCKASVHAHDRWWLPDSLPAPRTRRPPARCLCLPLVSRPRHSLRSINTTRARSLAHWGYSRPSAPGLVKSPCPGASEEADWLLAASEPPPPLARSPGGSRARDSPAIPPF